MTNARSFRAWPLALLAAFGLGAAAARGEGAAPDWTQRDERVAHPLKAGTPVCITNLVGDVRIREAAEPVLTIVAIVQQRRDDPRVAAIAAGDQLPCVVSAAFPGAAPAGLYPPGRAPRVDLAVLVPPGSPVFVTTAAGRIEAKGMSGDVTACSDTGKISVQTPGLIRATSRRGDIEAIVKNAGRGRAFRFASETGRIAVRLPHHGAAEVTARTAGLLASDFTMAVTRPATSTHKVARVHVGTSTVGRWLTGWFRRVSTIELASEQGDIQILAPFPDLEAP